ncbi:hypothetical protein [Streptomyces sp. NPDC088350]|uniref:hypothetical protein n=1 Tax=Streptomyces sp. NPDC088350 TaxID=3365854 RepID=UPI003816C533
MDQQQDRPARLRHARPARLRRCPPLQEADRRYTDERPPCRPAGQPRAHRGAARTDPSAKQSHTTHNNEVLRVEYALVAEGLLATLGLDAADLLALPWGRGLALAGIATITDQLDDHEDRIRRIESNR